MADLKAYKKMVVETAQKLTAGKYLVGTGGNISVRVEGEDLVAVTPSSMDYMEMNADDICIVDFNKQVKEGERRPSIETAMHIEVYKHRLDVGAVIHTHQIYPSMFALTGEGIPALFDEQVANMGDRIELVPYGLSGSEDLLKNIAAAVANQCNAFILQNHGALCVGMSLEKAVTNVLLLDKVSQAYCLVLCAGKTANPLAANATALLFALLKNAQKKEAERRQGKA